MLTLCRFAQKSQNQTTATQFVLEIMESPLNDQKLAELYSPLTPKERVELEEQHRGWIHDMMVAQATKEFLMTDIDHCIHSLIKNKTTNFPNL